MLSVPQAASGVGATGDENKMPCAHVRVDECPNTTCQSASRRPEDVYFPLHVANVKTCLYIYIFFFLSSGEKETGPTCLWPEAKSLARVIKTSFALLATQDPAPVAQNRYFDLNVAPARDVLLL